MNIYKRIRVSILWVGALEAASSENYSVALEKLDAIDRYEGIMPYPVEFQLLRAFSLYSTSQYERMFDHLLSAQELLSKKTPYNDHEKDYLMCYAFFLAKHSAKKVPSVGDEFLTNKFSSRPDCESIDLDSVRKSLKLSFPLRTHPDWQD